MPMSSKLPTHVKLIEVGPRDGLQNEAQTIPAEIKIGCCHAISSQRAGGGGNFSYVDSNKPSWVGIPCASYRTSTPGGEGCERRFLAVDLR